MPGYLDSPYAILDNYGEPGDSTTLDPTEEAKQRYAQAMPEPAPQASESYGGGGQQFGGYTPQPDTQTVGGSQAQMGSPAPSPAPLPSAPQARTGGDPFQGNNPYQGAMPQTDAAQQYLDEEIKYRREHQPSMLRKVLGTAASMYSPQIGRMIMDPRGHEEQFQRNMPLYQAKSKLEQDELTKQATIAQKRASDAYRASTESDRRNTELDRQDAGTENVPIENTPSSVTLPSGPPALGPPQGPPDPMAPPPDNPPPSLLASMRNPSVSMPTGGTVPLDTRMATPVTGGRPVPAGMQKVRPTALGVATAKRQAATAELPVVTQAVADLVPELNLKVGDPMDPTLQAGVLKIVEARQKPEKPPPMDDKEKFVQSYLKDKGVPDTSDNRATALQKYAAATQAPQRPERNMAAEDKAAAAAAIRSAFQSAGGDWQKVIDAERSNPSQYGSDIVDHATKMLTLPPAIQTKVNAADTTADMAAKGIQQIKDFVAAHPDIVGSVTEHPLAAGKRKVETWAGTEPADIGAVDTALASVAALQPGQHGFRSQQALEEFKKNLGIDPRTGKPDGSRAWLINPEKAIAGLQAVSDFNQSLKNNVLKNAGRGGGAQSGGSKPLTDPAVAADYLKKAGGDKAKARTLAQKDGWTF